MNHLQVESSNASLIAKWISKRGGVLVWRSLNLSNPSGQWLSPYLDEEGKVYTKPNWQCGNDPARHITSIDEVEVATTKEVKRFHVAVRQAGLSFKVTDGGSRRIHAEVEKAAAKHGKPAGYRFDYGDYDNAVIYIDDSVVPLSAFVQTQGAKP